MQIYNYNQGNPPQKINLKGILVGNGCLGNAVGICGNDFYGDFLQLRELKEHAMM